MNYMMLTPAELEQEKIWIDEQVNMLGMKTLQEMAKQAIAQKEFSYSPYSQFKIGVALLTKNGKIFTGNNAERVGYSETDHGEEAAVTNAIIHGAIKENGREFIQALVVNYIPCGRCRQIIVEHCDNCIIALADDKGTITNVSSIRMLLPFPFTPKDLGK